MKGVEPDRRSTHELYEELREAGRRKAAEQPRRSRGSAWRRSGVLAPAMGAILAFLLVGGGVAVGTRVFLHEESPQPAGRGVPRDVQHATGDRRTAQTTVADPGSASARWGMRIYPNPAGDTCLQPGRLIDGRIGAVQGGTFVPYPDDTVGNCTALDREHAMVAVWVYRLGTAPRSILYGAVDRTVTGLSIGREGAEEPVRIAPDGTYMIVRLGTKGFKGKRLVIDRSGTKKAVPLQTIPAVG